MKIIWNNKIKNIRSLMQFSSLRAKLKLIIHNRVYLINFSKFSIICLFLLIFIDAFELYRNMYRAIMKIYVIIIELNWRERKRRVNVLFLTLNSHVNNFFDVIKVFKSDLLILDKGVVIEINNIKYVLYVYIMIFIEDIKQQMKNFGFDFSLMNREYKKCLITKL